MAEKPKILVVFQHTPKGLIDWPRSDFDYEKRIGELTKRLEDSCPDVDFTTAVVHNMEGAKNLVKRSNEFDGFLVYLLGGLTGTPHPIFESGKPAVLAYDLYGGAGEFLFDIGWARARGFPVVGACSSNFEDVIKAVKLFKVVKRLSRAKIILVTSKDSPDYWSVKEVPDTSFREIYGTKKYGGSGETFNMQGQIDRIRKLFGTEVIRMSYEEINAYHASIPEREAEVLADRWMGEALRVVEPTRDEIVKSARMYLGVKKAMEERKADAFAIDCYAQFHKLAAYPCMSLFQLNNEGLTGTCEADLSSAMTQLLLRYLTEEMSGEPRPGFVNDPIVDPAAGRIIYAHCLASNKCFGPRGPANPYIIRSHAESRAGVAVQSLLPSGNKVTSVQVHFMREPPLMVMHQGETVGNEDAEEACRTKLVAKADVDKIMDNWNKKGGWVFPAQWHRVTIFGDWRKQLIDLAILMGMETFEEDKN